MNLFILFPPFIQIMINGYLPNTAVYKPISAKYRETQPSLVKTL